MLIDWFTVIAQVLNFLILVWLMKHFLYRPILGAIDAREKLIAAELADAATKKTEAQKDRDEFRQKNEEFDGQRAALLGKATDEAKTESRRLVAAAVVAAEALRKARQDALQKEAVALNQAITRRTQQEVFAIAGQALRDLGSVSLEARVGEIFISRLRDLEAPAKATLGAALKARAEPAVVRSAFELSTETRAAIQSAVNEAFSADIPLRFESAPALISGIELSAQGQKVAWSIADYLASLEKGVAEVLQAREKSVGQIESRGELPPKTPGLDQGKTLPTESAARPDVARSNLSAAIPGPEEKPTPEPVVAHGGG